MARLGCSVDCICTASFAEARPPRRRRPSSSWGWYGSRRRGRQCLWGACVRSGRSRRVLPRESARKRLRRCDEHVLLRRLSQIAVLEMVIRTPRGILNPSWRAISPLGRATRRPVESQISGGELVSNYLLSTLGISYCLNMDFWRKVPQPTRVFHEKRLLFSSSSVPQRIKDSTRPPESTKLRQTELTLPKPNRPALTLLLTLNYGIHRGCFSKRDFFARLLFPTRPTQLNYGIRATPDPDFGRFRTSRIGFGVILPIRRGLFWV